MKNTKVYRLLRHIYRVLIKTRRKQKKDKLIFVYGGRTVVLEKFTQLSGYYLDEPQYLRSTDLQPMTSLILSK